jgi:uncharacterized protein YukJ
MPLRKYGVLKGHAVNRQLGAGSSPHYQVLVVDDTTRYRIAINVQSQLSPSELEYLVDDRFAHPFIAQYEALPLGWSALPSKPGGPALDFIRTNLFDPRKLVPLPFNVPGPDNDLNEKIDHYVQRALAAEDAIVYAFGERWGPENGKRDKYFGFEPGNGVHDIHMNQGNAGRFTSDDGVYQDGALLFHFPSQSQWVGIFLKFQSQAWHTDDETGHTIQVPVSGPPSDQGDVVPPFQPGTIPTPEAPDGALRIVAALVNALESPEVEFVTILNTTAEAVDLAGWNLADAQKRRTLLQGQLGAGETLRVQVAAPMVLSNKGGLITLLNADGLRVDGVSYTKAQVSLPGFTVKF